MTSSHKKRIYTKYGDRGETSLLYGGRVSKSDPRTEAYGVSDEAVSTMGLARALSDDHKVKDILKELQKELFTVGAELATDTDKYDLFKQHFSPLTEQMVTRLEELIDELEQDMEPPKEFILPGASPASAAIDIARCNVRTVERRAVALKEAAKLTNAELLKYMNRLGDLLFVLARYQDREIPLEKARGEVS